MEKIKQYKAKRTSSKSFSERKRNKENKQFYDSQWTKYSYRFLHYNPKCYACGSDASQVDHIVAHKKDIDLFWNRSNHCPLCHGCHSYVTAKFDRHKPPLTEQKCKWLVGQRNLFNCQVKIKVVLD